MMHLEQERRVHYSAVIFRSLLDALARPGSIRTLEAPNFFGSPPTFRVEQQDIPSNLYALGAFLTLLDREVNFIVAAAGKWQSSIEPVTQWLALRSGAGVSESSETAAFALFCDGQSQRLLPQLSLGTPVEPEMSATAFYCVKRLAPMTEYETEASFIGLQLRGPGIETSRDIYVAGLEESELEAIQATRLSYPLGIDLYLIDESGHCIGLPRTTRIRNLR